MMNGLLSPRQLQVLQDCAKDPASLQRIMAVIEDIQRGNSVPPPAFEHQATTSALDGNARHFQLLQTISDTVPDHIYVKDRQCRFIMVNRAAWQTWGFAGPEAMIGKTDIDLFGETERDTLEAENQLMATGQASINHEVYAHEYCAVPMWFLISKMPLYDSNGHITGLIGINRNITDRKEAEQHALELAAERERIQVLSDFIRDASHEFRTPLSVIRAAAYLLKHMKEPDEHQLRQITSIETQASSILRLVEDLATMARLDSGASLNLQPVDLTGIIRAVLYQHREQANALDLHITLDLPDRLMLDADAEELQLAFGRLLENAIRYNRTGGSIYIHADTAPETCTVSIADTGMGITPDEITSIFNRLYRKDQARTTRGFGLGLPIARQIIEQHQGHIEVISKPDHGSTFLVVLPLNPSGIAEGAR
ncbi:MAG: hypothetical protein CL610_26735 [Anaerolineaceae bacterium]|nr:hypothetical protein [Anaerolineaceae bacterium]